MQGRQSSPIRFSCFPRCRVLAVSGDSTSIRSPGVDNLSAVNAVPAPRGTVSGAIAMHCPPPLEGGGRRPR